MVLTLLHRCIHTLRTQRARTSIHPRYTHLTHHTNTHAHSFTYKHTGVFFVLVVLLLLLLFFVVYCCCCCCRGCCCCSLLSLLLVFLLLCWCWCWCWCCCWCSYYYCCCCCLLLLYSFEISTALRRKVYARDQLPALLQGRARMGVYGCASLFVCACACVCLVV